jgi:hypothetical protein
MTLTTLLVGESIAVAKYLQKTYYQNKSWDSTPHKTFYVLTENTSY